MARSVSSTVLNSQLRVTPLAGETAVLVKQVETPTISRSVQIRLPYRPPLDWRAMLSYLQTRAIPGVEQLSADTYARTITLGGAAGVISVRFCHDSHSALLTMPASY